MSYQAIPRRRGLRGYNDLPGADPTAYPSITSLQPQAASVADQSKAQAIAFAQAQIANYPPATALKAEFDQYESYLKAIPGFDPAAFLQDPAKAEAWMKQALLSYAAANGIPTNTAQAKAYIASLASGALGVPIPSDWPTNTKDLKKACLDFACTATVMYTGVDPKIISVTADALADGKLSPDECEAIGGTAGAIAGAAIGQAVGIPAPIGAFVGNLIGRDIGGTLGQIFGAGQSGTEEMESRIAAARSLANSTLQQANDICTKARRVYWDTFDQLLLATELQWETTEAQIGWKFGLRWFGIESYTPLGQGFSHAWDGKRFSGPEIGTNRAVRVKTEHGSLCYTENGLNHCVTDIQYTYGCQQSYGCPYPPLPSGVVAEPGFERDVGAFLARGALWLPPLQRHYACSYRLPTLTELFDTNAKQAWIASMQDDLIHEQAAVQALKTISVTVIGDLIKTAAAVGAEKKINDLLKASAGEMNARVLARGKALAQAKSTGQNLSDLLNYGTLALGVGILGIALYRRES